MEHGHFVKILSFIKKTVSNIKNLKKSAKKQKPRLISSLIPIDNLSNEQLVIQELRRAIDYPEIYNIAVAGDYGSGKSSIINSFIRQSDDKENFCKISFASFSNEQPVESQITNDTDKLSFQEIEMGILQQLMLFKDKWGKIPILPYKFIKKSKCYEICNVFCIITLFYLPFTLFLFHCINYLLSFKTDLFTKNSFEDMYQISSDFFIILCKTIISIIIAIFIAFQLKKFYSKVLNSSFIRKIDLKTIGVELDQEIHLLDIYFEKIVEIFAKYPCTVVFIEDLDRFNSTKIYSKLREINFLLNQSDSINQKVSFVYAVRDDLFENQKRIKFFDSIITVVPFFSPRNSINYFYKYLSENKENDNEFSGKFIFTISKYISEKRLFNSIFSDYEFYKNVIFSQNQSDQNRREKLFALMVLKNLYPKQFSEINSRYSENIIEKYVSATNLYVITKINNYRQNIANLKKMEKDPFSYSKKEYLKYFHPFARTDLFDNISSEHEFVKEIKKLEEFTELNIKGIEDAGFSLNFKNYVNEKKISIDPFLYDMFSKGYIEQDYADYITSYDIDSELYSIKAFEKMLSNNESLDADFPLSNVNLLITYLKKSLFSKVGILNYSLIGELFKNYSRTNQIDYDIGEKRYEICKLIVEKEQIEFFIGYIKNLFKKEYLSKDSFLTYISHTHNFSNFKIKVEVREFLNENTDVRLFKLLENDLLDDMYLESKTHLLTFFIKSNNFLFFKEVYKYLYSDKEIKKREILSFQDHLNVAKKSLTIKEKNDLLSKILDNSFSDDIKQIISEDFS